MPGKLTGWLNNSEMLGWVGGVSMGGKCGLEEDC
jgi:hypothetical protein